MRLPTAQIEECGRVQVRAKTNPDVVKDYAESMTNGSEFPAITVFAEPETERYIVADGHHRLRAAKLAGIEDIEVELHQGTETDALEHALQCNAAHGLRLTNQDRLHAVGQLMSNPSLQNKYRTNDDRADLLHITRRHFQRLLAKWRDSEGGDDQERSAKEDAKQRAAKHTDDERDTGSRSDDQDENTVQTKEQIDPVTPSEAERPRKPAPTQDQVDARQIREAIKTIRQTGRDVHWADRYVDADEMTWLADWIGAA